MVKTPCFQCRGHKFIPSLAGEQRSHTPHGKKEKINKLIKISRKKRVNMHQTLGGVCLCVCVCVCVCVLVAQLCLQTHGTSLPGSSVHGILQARILDWVAIPFSRGSSQPRDQTQVSCIAGRFLSICATREAWYTCSINIRWLSLRVTLWHFTSAHRSHLKSSL